jgi:hypothetical protein
LLHESLDPPCFFPGGIHGLGAPSPLSGAESRRGFTVLAGRRARGLCACVSVSGSSLSVSVELSVSVCVWSLCLSSAVSRLCLGLCLDSKSVSRCRDCGLKETSRASPSPGMAGSLRIEGGHLPGSQRPPPVWISRDPLRSPITPIGGPLPVHPSPNFGLTSPSSSSEVSSVPR